jgi:hypothetical protein
MASLFRFHRARAQPFLLRLPSHLRKETVIIPRPRMSFRQFRYGNHPPQLMKLSANSSAKNSESWNMRAWLEVAMAVLLQLNAEQGKKSGVMIPALAAQAKSTRSAMEQMKPDF